MFFNQQNIEKPVNATVIITKTKQRDVYKIDYALKLSDNRIVKGVYTGKITEREK